MSSPTSHSILSRRSSRQTRSCPKFRSSAASFLRRSKPRGWLTRRSRRLGICAKQHALARSRPKKCVTSADSCCVLRTNRCFASIDLKAKGDICGSPFVSVIKEFRGLRYTLTEGALLNSPASAGSWRAHATRYVFRDPYDRLGNANFREHSDIREQSIAGSVVPETAPEGFGSRAYFSAAWINPKARYG